MPIKKLTAEQVREARRRVKAGESIGDVAEEMPVTVKGLSAAVLGTTWKHITDPGPVTTSRKGAANHNARLTADMVREARRRVNAGEEIADIVDDYPVTISGLQHAVRGRSWQHVQDPPPIGPQENVKQPTSRQSREIHVPDEATPCARCGILTTERYCRFCAAEGYAPSWSRPETSHPGQNRRRGERRSPERSPTYAGHHTTATSGENRPQQQNGPHLPLLVADQVAAGDVVDQLQELPATPIYGAGES